MEESSFVAPQQVTTPKETSFIRETLLLSASVILGSLIIAGAILTLSPQIGNKGTVAADTQNPTQKEDTNATVSIDDDPVLGDKTKAKVAIVEFSDYECPFCKKFHAETYDSLVKEYVDSGKAIIVFRDFPLSFHDPKATMEAATAECVRDEKGDAAYFAFGKALYENTQANGKGLPDGKLQELIKKVGANVTKVTACAEKSSTTQEIAKDITDGQKIGVDGTPSFIIGTLSSDGTVKGERIVGALPLSGMKATIEKYLQ